MHLTQSHKIYKLVNTNPKRNRVIIGNYTDSNLDILTYQAMDIEDYNNNGFRLKEYGVLEVENYIGEFYGVCDIDNTEVRIIQFEGVK